MIKNAFTYMFKDNLFKKKALIYFCFILVANLLLDFSAYFSPKTQAAVTISPDFISLTTLSIILNILGCIIMFIPSGYGISCLKAIMEQKENIVLPFINIKNNFITGFKLVLSIVLISLALALFTIFLAIIINLVGGMSTPTLNMTQISMSLLFFAVVLIILFCSPAFICIFTKKEYLTTFFRYIKAFKLISKGIGTYLKGIGLFILIAIVSGIIGAIITAVFEHNAIVSTIVSSFTSSVLGAYLVFVYAYITANIVKHEFIE